MTKGRRVGGLISVSNLAEDLRVSPATVSKWIAIFERMYLVFVVRPYANRLPRSIQKPFKLYFFDNADVVGPDGARFENLVAAHLLKRCHFLQDYTGERWELGFLRNKEKQEVDFIILRDGKIMELIESKFRDEAISPALLYFKRKLGAGRATQIVANQGKPVMREGVRLISPIEYFSGSKELKQWF